jgi:hypothetical protein
VAASAAAAAEPKNRVKRKHKALKKVETPKKLKAEEEKKDAPPTPSLLAPPPAPIKLIKDEELHCIVCMEFPTEGEIYQCKHGHLLCKTCHQSLIESDKPLCPACRVRMSRENPSRNRIAEMVLSGIMVDCANKSVGCKTQHKFSEVGRHEKEECEYRPAQCKWEPLGCEWKGFQKDAEPHVISCPIRTKSPKKLLKLVLKRNERKENEQRALQDLHTRQAQVCQLLSGRCCDMVMRDVHIEPDPLRNDKCSKTFTAFGIPWECVLAPQPTEGEKKEGKEGEVKEPPKVGIFLRIVAPVKKKVVIKVFVLKGPSLLYDLTPSSYKIMFKRKKRKSEVFYLPFDPAIVSQVLELDTINLRMGFVNVSTGRPRRGFTSSNDVGGRSSDDDSSSDSDYDYDDLEEEGVEGIDDDDESEIEVMYDSGGEDGGEEGQDWI